MASTPQSVWSNPLGSPPGRVDGNGRVGRLLFPLMFLGKGGLPILKVRTGYAQTD
jgi:hypothetical protein